MGGYRLHLYCTGSGSPTLVLEPGQGGVSSDFGWIAPAVARDSTVCVYDRAGRGWSDAADGPQDGDRIAADLHTLLDRAHVPGPYVLAGHSFGGLYVQSFAAMFPDQDAGMVLLDSTAPKPGSALPMPQLVEAVIEEGFHRLADGFAGIELSEDPVADMTRQSLAYHEAGRQNPHLFDLMFGLSTPGGYRQIARPRRTPRAEGGSALDEVYLPEVVNAQRAIHGKRFRRQDPERVAAECWSFVHGLTALELGGYFSQFEDPITDVFASLMRHVAVGLGDMPQRAGRSIAAAIATTRG